MVAWNRFGRNAGVAIGMAGVTGGVEDFLAIKTVGTGIDRIFARLVGGCGKGLGNANEFEGQRFQISPKVEQLLGSEFGLVAHVMDDTDKRRFVDCSIGVLFFRVLAPPSLAIIGVIEAMGSSDKAVRAFVLVKVGVAVATGKTVIANRRRMEKAPTGA